MLASIIIVALFKKSFNKKVQKLQKSCLFC